MIKYYCDICGREYVPKLAMLYGDHYCEECEKIENDVISELDTAIENKRNEQFKEIDEFIQLKRKEIRERLKAERVKK